MKALVYLSFLLVFLLIGCKNEPSLQKYFVENSEKKNFIALDFSPSVVNANLSKLTNDEKEALKSFSKMNVLAFKKDKNNAVDYNKKKEELEKILKNNDYSELIRVGSGKDGGSISYLGQNEDDIDEFIVFGKKDENGFAVVRILGDNMNPNNIMTMLSVLKNSNIDMEQLKPLQNLMK